MMGNKITLSRCIVGILSTLLLLATLVSSFQQQTVANGWLYRYRRRYPLHYAPTDPSIIASNRQYLSNRMGFSEEKLDKLEDRNYPCSILTLDIGILDERANWLKNRFSLTENQIKKITQLQPMILGRPSESDGGLASKIEYLQKRLPLLNDAALGKLIQRRPQIIGISISENIEPTLVWLQQRLLLDDVALSRLIILSPGPLTLSIPDNMEPKLDWLQQRLSLTDDELSKLIQRLPALFGYNIHTNIEPKLDWLQQRLSLTDEQLSKMIQRLPSLFCYNIDSNLEPTLNFYIDALGDETAISFVTNNPSSLGMSLEKKLKPRLEEARAAGMKIDSTCLQHIWRDTIDKWNERVIMCVANELCRY